MELYTFFRSSAAYRVRIALNLKELDYTAIPIHFRKDGGQHRTPEFLKMNPQGLLPVLKDDDVTLNQSLAIIEYLDEVYPTVRLLPADAVSRAEVRSMALMIACEIHPLNNLRVLGYLKDKFNQDDNGINEWYQYWVSLGFEALEEKIKSNGGSCCFQDSITLADVCLIPQTYNALRFNCDMEPFPNILRIYNKMNELMAFQNAAPENQLDAK